MQFYGTTSTYQLTVVIDHPDVSSFVAGNLLSESTMHSYSESPTVRPTRLQSLIQNWTVCEVNYLRRACLDGYVYYIILYMKRVLLLTSESRGVLVVVVVKSCNIVLVWHLYRPHFARAVGGRMFFWEKSHKIQNMPTPLVDSIAM